MDLLIIPLLAVCLWGVRFCREGYFADYLSVNNTRAVRGILALLVMLHHIYQELGPEAGMLHLLLSNMGVPCVILFLFFSGYGLQKSFETKPGYGKTLLKRRIPAILVPFLVLIPLYWLVYWVIGTPWSAAQVLKSLVSGSPIVRYGWYTQCQILLYLVFALCAPVFAPRSMPVGVLILTLGLALGLMLLGYGPYWYYSIPAFPAGLFWAAWEDRLLPRMDRKYWLWLVLSFLSFGACFAGALKTFHTVLYWGTAFTLPLVMVLVLRKGAFRNPVLDFLGGISFEIYSIHGLFMLLYRSRILSIGSDLLLGAAVVASSIPAAWLLNRVLRKRATKRLEHSEDSFAGAG